ncbi:MAG: methionyl-tRNA formyltransferase [Pseudomonadota bacterium]
MPQPPLSVLFAGTPEFAALHLRALIDSKHTLIGVLTQPDRPAGRGKKLLSSPVKQAAANAGLPIFQPATLNDSGVQSEITSLDADLLVVVAYGLLLPQAVLDLPPLGCLNVHASLLPRWRGAAPMQRAIEAGDSETGVTIMQMDAGLDTGDMLATGTCSLGPNTTTALLHDQLAEIGAPLLIEVLDDLHHFRARATIQNDALATYASKVSKQEAVISWQEPVLTLDRRIRAFNPFPGCFTYLNGERIKIWRGASLASAATAAGAGVIANTDHQGIVVNCLDGQLAIHELQLPGGKRLGAQQVLNARRDQFAPGNRFSASADG